MFQDVKSMKEHKVDIEVSTIFGSETKIVKQVSFWRPAGITWVRLKPNTADELSWDRAKARLLFGGVGLDIACAHDIEI